MAKERAHIIAMQNGVPKGYVKSISYTKGTFTLIQDKAKAKGYVKADIIQGDIDFLTRIGYAYGYTFIYN